MSERQGQVLLELAWFGGTDAEIAQRLGISHYTVKAHIASMRLSRDPQAEGGEPMSEELLIADKAVLQARVNELLAEVARLTAERDRALTWQARQHRDALRERNVYLRLSPTGSTTGEPA